VSSLTTQYDEWLAQAAFAVATAQPAASSQVVVAEPRPQVEPPLPQPDHNGEFAAPLDGALWMAETFGIPQIPLKGKAPFLPDWPNKATTDSAQIRQWAAEYPDCNFGSAAVPGHHFIFEADKPADGVKTVRERFKDTGHDFSARLIIESSPGKGHRYYLSVPEIENIGQNAVRHGDFSVRVDHEQCVSPGSVHPTTGKQYRVATHYGPLAQPTPHEIAFWKSERIGKKSAGIAQQAQIPDGQRNSTLTSIAGKLLDAGMTAEKVKQEIREINQERCSPPLSDNELERTIFVSIDKWSKKEDSITRQIQAPKLMLCGKVIGQEPQQVQTDPAGWRDQFRTVGQLEQGNIRMLIDGFLPEGTSFIGGLPGEGKSWLALSIAKALTTGRDFLGMYKVPEVVPVIYLVPESSGRAFRMRCETMRIPDDPKLFLCRTISEGRILPLNDQSLFEAVAELKPVIILDTLIRFREGDENDAAQNKELVDAIIRLRQAGAVAVIGIHHAAKDMRKKGMSLELALRGTGDIAAAADAVYGILRDSHLYRGGRGPNEFEIECLKPRDFVPPDPFRVAVTKKPEKSDGMVIGMISMLDRFHDLVLVSDKMVQNTLADALEQIISEDPGMSAEKLKRETGAISEYQVKSLLQFRGWTKGKGPSGLWTKLKPEEKPVDPIQLN